MTDGTLHREFLSEPDLAAYRYVLWMYIFMVYYFSFSPFLFSCKTLTWSDFFSSVIYLNDLIKWYFILLILICITLLQCYDNR